MSDKGIYFPRCFISPLVIFWSKEDYDLTLNSNVNSTGLTLYAICTLRDSTNMIILELTNSINRSNYKIAPFCVIQVIWFGYKT